MKAESLSIKGLSDGLESISAAKRRSKWARALRYAAASKPDDESIKKFIERKGGIVIALKQEFDLPVKLVGTGEQIDDLALFDPDEFSKEVLEA